MHEVCEHVYHLLRAEAGAAIVIERDYDPSLPNAMLDRNQIIQALLNVARNAMQAARRARPDRVAHARAFQRQHRVRAAIGSSAVCRWRMTARGFPRSCARASSIPWSRGVPTAPGLGLAVAQELVSRNGGIIEFESESGRTVFTLLLPLGEAA